MPIHNPSEADGVSECMPVDWEAAQGTDDHPHSSSRGGGAEETQPGSETEAEGEGGTLDQGAVGRPGDWAEGEGVQGH